MKSLATLTTDFIIGCWLPSPPSKHTHSYMGTCRKVHTHTHTFAHARVQTHLYSCPSTALSYLVKDLTSLSESMFSARKPRSAALGIVTGASICRGAPGEQSTAQSILFNVEKTVNSEILSPFTNEDIEAQCSSEFPIQLSQGQLVSESHSPDSVKASSDSLAFLCDFSHLCCWGSRSLPGWFRHPHNDDSHVFPSILSFSLFFF